MRWPAIERRQCGPAEERTTAPPGPTQATPTVSAPRAARPAPRRPPLPVLLAVGSGGASGAVARYELALAAPVPAGAFPWTTWAINLTGSFVLGVIALLVLERWPPTRYVRPFVGIGFCGGYTTWSTFMTETVLLARDHRPGLAATYLTASLSGGLVATYAGTWAARRPPRRRRPT
jgi:CrcB protein